MFISCFMKILVNKKVILLQVTRQQRCSRFFSVSLLTWGFLSIKRQADGAVGYKLSITLTSSSSWEMVVWVRRFLKYSISLIKFFNFIFFFPFPIIDNRIREGFKKFCSYLIILNLTLYIFTYVLLDSTSYVSQCFLIIKR